jgi:PAS domain-containing protein
VRWHNLLTDIDDRKRAEAERSVAEEALGKSEERWRAVFENSAIGVALTDTSGRFMATNSAYQKMLGYTEEEIGRLTSLETTRIIANLVGSSSPSCSKVSEDSFRSRSSTAAKTAA